VRVPESVRDEFGRTVLDFHFDQPARPVDLGMSADERRLGLHLGSLTLEPPTEPITPDHVDRSLPIGRPVSFVQGSGAERLLGDGWSGLERTGVWTIAHAATISFQLPADAGADLELVLAAHAHVTPRNPELGLVVSAGGQRLRALQFRHGVKSPVVSVPLDRAVVNGEGLVVVELGIDHPVSPKELGTGIDARPLGLHLQSLMVRRTGVRGQWDMLQHQLRRADPRRRASDETDASLTS
jgi:hypothetical protein